jgi:uncharacterized protein (TIGR02118 family)
MVKLVALYDVPTDPAAFDAYYHQTHMPIALTIPGLIRGETARILGTAEGGEAPYYRVAELCFADMAQLQAGASSPEGQATLADLANFATGGATLLIAETDAVYP